MSYCFGSNRIEDFLNDYYNSCVISEVTFVFIKYGLDVLYTVRQSEPK